MEKVCRICNESRPIEKFSRVYKDKEDNYMKNKTSMEEFIKNCKKIAELHS